jgi:hypothetical protein
MNRYMNPVLRYYPYKGTDGEGTVFSSNAKGIDKIYNSWKFTSMSPSRLNGDVT